MRVIATNIRQFSSRRCQTTEVAVSNIDSDITTQTPKLSVNKLTCLQFCNLLTYTSSENIEIGVN